MELIFWLGGFLALLAGGTAWVTVRSRRSRSRAGDADATISGERSHSDALAAAHTAGQALGPQ
ncbi:hypothetical protein [Agromyces sp. NBRC 114283]|uniref:hypothetical protein n=1 Tax=Agromyces sp. NBRC 114283 TaxID=2994521 RepID=UPI0024A4A7D1|nr:hypothetical protein [Agromyces sp. NBRC 114283]GLU90078.1 hypothetical protein Agsp01_23330 [Agromyces sp. NBRC 114283]